MPSAFENRFVRTAGQNAPGFAQAVQQRYGHPPATVSRLLEMLSKLSEPAGGTLNNADVKFLKAAHPLANPKEIEEAARVINDLPARVRAQVFTGAVSGDRNAATGNLVDAGAGYREVQNLQREFQTQAYADAINARRDAGAAKDDKYKGRPAREAPEAWKPEPGSVRDLIEKQIVPKPVRDFGEAVDAGDPTAQAVGRHLLANTIDHAADRLEAPGESTRDTVAAAFDLHEASSAATEQFGVTAGDNQ